MPARLEAALATGFGRRTRQIRSGGELMEMPFAAMAEIRPRLPPSMDQHHDLLKLAPRLDGLRGRHEVIRLAGHRRMFSVRLDDGRRADRLAGSVVVGNVGLLPGAGFARLLPDARLDRQLARRWDPRSRRPGRLRAGVATLVLTSSHRRRPEPGTVRVRRGRDRGQVLGCRGGSLGRSSAWARSLTVTLRPTALVVRVPGELEVVALEVRAGACRGRCPCPGGVDDVEIKDGAVPAPRRRERAGQPSGPRWLPGTLGVTEDTRTDIAPPALGGGVRQRRPTYARSGVD